jgi:radical SAM superfamily enzyme YgiQ (UPF0313 family)
MRYEGQIFRPPSEADAYILQATIGCSHNKCTYCAMYRDKSFRIRALDETLEDIEIAGAQIGDRVDKLFVADGDALIMDMAHWRSILEAARSSFPRLKRVSCYAMARNVTGKSPQQLEELRALGLRLLYIGPESGDPTTLKRIVKGNSYDDHVEAAQLAHQAGMAISVIALLGAGGVRRSQEHAQATARLVTEMDPEFFSALTLTVVPGTPMERLVEKEKFELPDVQGLLTELRIIVDETRPSDALFRTNHASNHLPLGGRLPADRERIVTLIDKALEGEVRLRPEWSRGL